MFVRMYVCVRLQREAERRESLTGDYVELSKIEEVVALKREQSKEESLRKKRDWKAKIQQAVNNRPSLISRQNQVMSNTYYYYLLPYILTIFIKLLQNDAKATAAMEALGKVASAVGTVGKKDDLFDEEERIKLGFMEDS